MPADKFAQAVVDQPIPAVEVDYFQDFLTAETKHVVLARLNQKLAEGWKIIYTDHRFNASQAAPVEVFHVLARG
jgi:hypothetical protein